MSVKKSIYIIYTGGTIGMQRTPDGYQPVHGYLHTQLATMPELKHPDMPYYFLQEYEHPIDSSNITPSHWNTIAADIAKRYDEFDGFVILHGTDTLAYSASALSFMLENLTKPVIFTGSQVPFAEIRNDARQNLLSAIMLASNYPIPEVCLYFDNQLFRGNRARKTHANGFDAFESPNFAPLATLGTDIKIHYRTKDKPRKSQLKIHQLDDQMLVSIRLFPGFATQVLKQVLTLPLRGLILETFGAGNAPNHDPEFLAILQEANNRGIILVNCTQCIQGSVGMEQYATGHALLQAGLISAHDMTPEAVLTKLLFLFSQKLPLVNIKELMQRNLRGELTNL